MVRTRSQLENLSKEELIEELISVEDISSKLSNLTSRFDNFFRRYKILSPELSVSKNYSCLLSERIVQLARNCLEINPVPASIGDDVLENSVCKVSEKLNEVFSRNARPGRTDERTGPNL